MPRTLRAGWGPDRTPDAPRRDEITAAIPAHTPTPAPPPAETGRGDVYLVERARAGDDDAFAALVGRYERKLLRVLTRLVHDPELARDLAQETFWRVYTRLDRFDTARRFGPWLFRVGVNLGLDALRRRSLPLVSIDEPLEHGRAGFDLPDPDPREREELAQEVQFLLDRIHPADRTVLVLRDLEGFSSAEVAAIIGKREATVRWRLARARERFRADWERREADSPPRSPGDEPAKAQARARGTTP
jgi:RNA polymerase sigma-70 factor (ECF subfamily)